MAGLASTPASSEKQLRVHFLLLPNTIGLVEPNQASKNQQDSKNVFPIKAVQKLSFLNDRQCVSYNGIAV